MNGPGTNHAADVDPAPLPPFDAAPGSIPTLPVPDPAGWRHLHLVGIGGAGMRGIAEVLLARGVRVSGSDLKESAGLERLRAAGATIFVGHRAEQVDAPDAVVISSAVPAANSEARAARDRGIPVLMRAQVLAALTRGARTVAVTGTHGKTTTTSMVAVMLSRLGLDPTYVIGGDLNESGSGAGAGRGAYFVAEADESDGSFLLFRPEVAVVTNVEADHLDFYGSPDRIERAFAQFARQAATVVACWDDPGVRRALAGSPATVIRYGAQGPNLDLRVVFDEDQDSTPRARFVIEGHEAPLQIELSVGPRHNLLNAAAAVGVALALHLPVEEALSGIASYGGVHRRFESKGEAAGVRFVDDYAIHPTEIASVLEAARGRAGGRVIGVFQPHRYSRTAAMWGGLGASLAAADVAVVTDVYAAWEDPIPGVSGKLVVDSLAEAAPGKRIIYLPHRADVAALVAGLVRPGDLVVTLGAGDITTVADETVAIIRDGAEAAR
ncbi:MAG TPA: UDP-N-acetylmuramate--L-alanine ligase [Actinomycetota bacterium]|nr:UDP-N-acetylmuramate--L-alanine ligase [Actinomycetota bacterium]